jgi:hypothetical protein
MPSFASFSEPGLWLIVAFAAAIVLLIARYYSPAPWRTWLAPAYWFFIPYFALLAGAVSPRLMGLFWIDWRMTFQVGAGLLLAIGLLALLAWLFVLPRNEIGGGANGSQRVLWIALAGAEEWFWCFLRAALWEIALTAPQTPVAPLYLAVWGAALLALPLVLVLQESGRLRFVKTAILVVTTVAFLFTRNFWLCWLIHASLAVLFTPAAVRPQQHGATASQTQ